MIDPDLIYLDKYRQSLDLTKFPKKFLRWYNAASEEEKTKWFTMRFKCLKSPRYLSGYVEAAKTGDPDLPKAFVPILGMDFQANPHDELFKQFLPMRPGENVVYSDLDTATKKRMVLWPRGLFKTSAIVVIIVQIILNYPNIRICFLTGNDDLAKRQEGRIKKIFEQPSEMFMWLFPEYCSKDVRNKHVAEFREDGTPNPEAWVTIEARLGTQHEFTVPCRTNFVFAEPTFAISTAKSVKSGAHFDFIFIDDLVNDQNYQNPKALEKCFQNYLDICPVLDPVGFMILTGTRYSFADTYGRIQELSIEEEKKLGKTIWTFSIRDCWSYGCGNCPHTGVYHDYSINKLQPPCTKCNCMGFQSNEVKGVLFPAARTVDGRSIGHTLEWLEGEKIRVGPEFFANQYENRPIAAESQTFTEVLIGAQTLHYEQQLPNYAQSYTFVVGDLAYVGQEGRDYSVLFICRKFQGRLYIIDCDFGNWDSAQIAEHTVDVLLKHRPDTLYYEKFNGWEAYDNIITTHAKTRGVTKVPIQWIKGGQTANAKLTRIGAIKGVLTNRRLWIFASIKGYDILVNQLVKWPKLGTHDDFADCAGLVVEAPTGYQLEDTPVPQSTTNWLHKLHGSESVADTYYDNGCGSGLCC